MDDTAGPSPATVAALQACAESMAAEHSARHRTLVAIAALSRTDAVVETGHRSLSKLLVECLHVDPGEARRLIRHAALLVAPEPGVFDGAAPEPVLPATAQVASEGGLGEEHVDVVWKTVERLRAVSPVLPDGVVEEVERQLADLARARSPQQLAGAAHEVLLRLDPDGEVPHDTDRPVEELRLHSGRDGTLSGRFRFAEPETAALIRSALESRTPAPDPEADTTVLHPGRSLDARRGEALRLLAEDAGPTDPHPDITDDQLPEQLPEQPSDDPADDEPSTEETAAEKTTAEKTTAEKTAAEKTAAEENAEGPADEASGEGPSGEEPAGQDRAGEEHAGEEHAGEAASKTASGAARPSRDRPSRETTVIVTVDLDTLTGQHNPASPTSPQRGPGFGLLDGLHPLSPATARRLACDAGIVPAVIGSRGEPLDLGRRTRVISTAQRRAVIARDHHCAHPGCRRSPRRCDVHHVLPWHAGGATEIHNLVLLCPYHHHQHHHSDWHIHMRDGLPTFIPPAWLDPLQTPRTHRTLPGAA